MQFLQKVFYYYVIFLIRWRGYTSRQEIWNIREREKHTLTMTDSCVYSIAWLHISCITIRASNLQMYMSDVSSDWSLRVPGVFVSKCFEQYKRGPIKSSKCYPRTSVAISRACTASTANATTSTCVLEEKAIEPTQDNDIGMNHPGQISQSLYDRLWAPWHHEVVP